MSRVARCVHMSPSMAGATTTGALVARQAAVTVSFAIPFAIEPEPAGRGGRDHKRVGRVRDHDVADPLVGEQAQDIRLDGVSRERREREWTRRTGSRPA